MVSRSATTLRAGDIKHFKYIVKKTQVSLDDTVILPEFTSAENLKVVTLVRDTDGIALTTSIHNNVVTNLTSGTNMDCTLFAFGVAA
jgi:hypothetical protein